MLIKTQFSCPTPHLFIYEIPSLILTLFILDTILTMIKNLKGKATLLVRSQAEIERRWIFFSPPIFFPLALCGMLMIIGLSLRG